MPTQEVAICCRELRKTYDGNVEAVGRRRRRHVWDVLNAAHVRPRTVNTPFAGAAKATVR